MTAGLDAQGEVSVTIEEEGRRVIGNGVHEDVTDLEDPHEHADFVGSLVLPPGDSLRPTAWNHVPSNWFPF